MKDNEKVAQKTLIGKASEITRPKGAERRGKGWQVSGRCCEESWRGEEVWVKTRVF